MDLIPRLREVAREAAGGELALIGGITAESYDNRAGAERRRAADRARSCWSLILLVLIALLRCIVAPLYVIGTVILSFAFALGASSLIFTHVFGQPDSDPNLTIFAFIFLVALGVDDNIFLMTRIREERRRGLATRDAVIAGLEKTGGVITSAGLILAGTFAALMALELEALFQVGFTVVARAARRRVPRAHVPRPVDRTAARRTELVAAVRLCLDKSKRRCTNPRTVSFRARSFRRGDSVLGRRTRTYLPWVACAAMAAVIAFPRSRSGRSADVRERRRDRLRVP